MKTTRAFAMAVAALFALAAGPAWAAQERGPQGQAGERGGAVRGGEAGPRGAGGAGGPVGGSGAAVPGGIGSAGSAGTGGGTLPGLAGGAVQRPGGVEAMPSRVRGGDFSRVGLQGEAPRVAVPRGEPVATTRGATLEAVAGAGFAEGSAPVREVPQYSRPRGDRPPVGRAVPRGAAPSQERRLVLYPPYYTPNYWSWAYYTPDYWYWYPYGVGYPWYGSYGLGFLYYDPWWWHTPGYYPPGYSAHLSDVGQLRLKVKPRHAEVYVDGYFVGTVDQFDGVFQRLRLRTGAHRVEIRAEGYEPLVFDVLIPPYDTVTYTGELKRRAP